MPSVWTSAGDRHTATVFFENDSKYSFDIVISDKAGNESEKSIAFSVNRFGSVYSLDEATEKLNNSHVKEAHDVVIVETNANELKNIKVTLFKNDQTLTLKKGDDYRIDKVGGEGQ